MSFSFVNQGVSVTTRIKYLIVYIILPITLSLVLYEIYYRVSIAWKIYDRFSNANIWIQNKPLQAFNAQEDTAGTVHPNGVFRFNEVLDISVIPPKSKTAVNFSVQTNNLGLLSAQNYSLARSASKPEYRIVVLGDSMTGPSTSTYQWVDTIQELLNNNYEFKAAIAGKDVKVYNIGWIGAGFNEFANVFERSGKHFDPDLVIINYIEIDFTRTNTAGPYKGVHLTDEKVMIEHALHHLEKIHSGHTNVVMTAMPVYDELIKRDIKLPRTETIKVERPEWKIFDMRERLPEASMQEIYYWYNLPLDAHYSDRGGELYARALSSLIHEHVTAKKHDYYAYDSQYSNLVLGNDSNNLRQIVNSTYKFTSNVKNMENIRNEVIYKLISSRIFKLKPWFIEHIQKTGIDGLSIPYTKVLTGGWETFKLDKNDDEALYMNIVCTSGDINLNNPNCYTHMHMYMEIPS